ncbi:anthranilate synthase component II [Parafrankia elaeagni]|uniref:anthranilate synthase component II n=1 Tax=Parafrankia elaeagni TaxID=222534 RepID=UPI00036D06EF|nr:aminodeoxychorismate/anthranilate synthase component II [Parafrankia elaeagni]
MTVFVVDAYDSFVHIIVEYLGALGADTAVVRSGTHTPDGLASRRPSALVLGPGPGHPADSGHVELVNRFAGELPVLGVCLGHQAIALAFGGGVHLADNLMHGRTSTISHDGAGVFAGLSDRLTVTRYHSIVVAEPLPAGLVATARSTDDGHIMGLRHRDLPIEGLQFHPESIATPDGSVMLANFLAAAVS